MRSRRKGGGGGALGGGEEAPQEEEWALPQLTAGGSFCAEMGWEQVCMSGGGGPRPADSVEDGCPHQWRH